jgi:Fur family ferric uptake transcriptional regulator
MSKKIEAADAAKTGKRNTWQKDAVRHALGEATGFVSAQQLHLVATVYRALADLASAGEADSLQNSGSDARSGNEILYRACGTDHHHHLICRGCGKTVEIEASRVEKWADEVAKEHGFSNPSHTIDIFGLCGDCD